MITKKVKNKNFKMSLIIIYKFKTWKNILIEIEKKYICIKSLYLSKILIKVFFKFWYNYKRFL